MAVKDDVLAMLLANYGEPLSGQRIAEQLQVSRNAIWKAIAQLKAIGYQIESERKGYTLQQVSTELDVAQIGLDILAWGNLHIEVHDTVTSTNDLAKQFVSNHQNGHALFVATKQTQGRGRYGRAFYSELSDGLYFTLVIRPDKEMALSDVPQYTLVAATAMAQALEHYTDKALRIKWINDLFYRGKKVGGILCEAITDIETQSISAVIVGIGLNLAGNFEKSDEATQQVAGTLFDTLPSTFNRNQLLNHYLRYFMQYHQQLKEKAHLPFYANRLLGLGQTVTYTQQGMTDKGMILGIDESGHLRVQQDNGEIVTLFGSEIHFSSQQFIQSEEPII